MRRVLTIRELYLESIPSEHHNENFKFLFDKYPFIFHSISTVLSGTTDYTKLQAYLSSKPLGSGQDYNYCYLDRTFFNLYGQKYCNVVIDNYRYDKPFSDDEVSYDSFGKELARSIITRFGSRWEQYINELELEYQPLHNYDMTEHEEVNSSITVSGNEEHTVQGFNSNDYKPESKNEDSHTTSGNVDDNFRDLNRYGNIGVTTSQQMLEAEIKLRDENVLIKRLFKDVSNFITVGVYD